MYRKSERNDCEGIYRLICELEGKELPPERFSSIYLEQLGNRNYYCLICERDGRVAGVLNLRFEDQLHHAGRIAEILEFAVAAQYRSRGIGKEMLAEACRIAKEHGCGQIEVACNRMREEAHRFYQREGMEQTHYKFSEKLEENERCNRNQKKQGL